MSKKNISNSEILLFKKYNLVKNIGGGAFGTVFLGTNVITRENVAIKIEERKNRSNLEREAYILYYLKGPGLPEVISFGKTKKYFILIQTLLGKSLYDLFNDYNKQFTLKDICMLGIQLIERLQYIHSKNYIHRDIKPHNFLIGEKNEGLIYIIDFGLSKKYRTDRGKHVKFNISKHITGTPRFCSVNAMRGVEQSRRDDLESLSYLIVYFFKGYLPWQGLKIGNKYQRFQAITKMKKYLKVESLCEELPEEIVTFCKYTRNLKFAQDPDYEYMKNLFFSILNKNGFINDKQFSWIKEGNNNIDKYKNINSYKNNYSYKNSPHKRLYQKIQMSLERKRKEIKQKEINQEYTLNTIYMDNKNITNDNSIQKNNFIQSNDTNVLQNNLFQLNLDNYKHSYNYPLVIYSNKLEDNNKNNQFSQIAKSFKGNDNIIVEENQINIPEKISLIDATKSNLINFQSDSNQIIIIPESNETNRNKKIKLHDYIRQEEKEGGVIGKDFDYKENDFFNVNTPLYNEEKQEKEKIDTIPKDTNDKNNFNINKNSKNNTNPKNNVNSKNNANPKNNSNLKNNEIQNNKINHTINLNGDKIINQIKNKDKNFDLIENRKKKSLKKVINYNINNASKDNEIKFKKNNSNSETELKWNNINYIPKFGQSYIKHANINLDINEEINNEIKNKRFPKTNIKSNLINFKINQVPKNLFTSNNTINNNSNNINKQKNISKNIGKINNINNNIIKKIIINSKNQKNNNNIQYIKLNNNKNIIINKGQLNSKKNNKKISINDNIYKEKHLSYSNSFNSNLLNENNNASDNTLLEIYKKARNKGKIIKKIKNYGDNYLLNAIGDNPNNLIYKNANQKNQKILNVNENNVINNKLINVKKNNNIIINNVIIKSNCNNLVSKIENEKKKTNKRNLDSSYLDSSNKIKSQKFYNYRPLSIRNKTYNNFKNIPYSMTDITDDKIINN